MDQQWFYGRQICIPVYSRFLDLKTLQSWENEWQKSFKADKYFIIPAGTKNTKINYEYKIHKQDLEKVPHSKYLGVTLSKDLPRKPHINNIIKKSNKTWDSSEGIYIAVHKK